MSEDKIKKVTEAMIKILDENPDMSKSEKIYSCIMITAFLVARYNATMESCINAFFDSVMQYKNILTADSRESMSEGENKNDKN